MAVTGKRRQVWNGTAQKTKSGLTKSDFKLVNGKITSKRASAAAKKRFKGELKKAFQENRAKPF